MNNYKNHPHLSAAKKLSNSIGDIQSKTVHIVTTDPFTKQPITKPVKNKHCQHVYDQASIQLMFQSKLFISCPYIGCTNSRFTKKDLVPDYKA